MKSKYRAIKAGISTRERSIIDDAVIMGKLIITAEEVIEALKMSKQQSNLFLSRLAKKGWLQRLKSGVYRILPLGSDSANPIPENAWSIAMEIFSPGYIGGLTAAEYWDLTEQIFNTTVFFTAKPQRQAHHNIAGLRFKTKFSDGIPLFGTSRIWPGNKLVLVSDIHRTLIDVMDDPSMGGGGRAMIDIARSYAGKKEASIEILLDYAVKLGHGAVFKRLGIIAEKILHANEDQLAKIKLYCRSGIISLDPKVPAIGNIIARWGIRLNIPLHDIE